MQTPFLPKFFTIEIDEEGRIKQVKSDEPDFLDLDFKEFKNTYLIDWIFEPQKETFKKFLQNYKSHDGTSDGHLGIWFSNRKNK